MVLVHIGIAGTSLRERFVRAMGERAFRIAFSVASIANIVWLGLAWSAAGPVRVLWHAPQWIVVVCMLLLVPACIFLVGSLTVANPTSISAGARALQSDTPAKSILRVTRYPMMWSFALWAATHMIISGTLSAMIFTGAFLIVAVLGMFNLDVKYARRAPQHWDAFARVTSIVPFVAILQGRNRLVFSEIGAWRIGLGLVLWAGLVALHPVVFGVDAWRYFMAR